MHLVDRILCMENHKFQRQPTGTGILMTLHTGYGKVIRRLGNGDYLSDYHGDWQETVEVFVNISVR